MSPKIRDFEHYTEGIPVPVELYVAFVAIAVGPVLAFCGGAVLFRVAEWALAGFPVVGL